MLRGRNVRKEMKVRSKKDKGKSRKGDKRV